MLKRSVGVVKDVKVTFVEIAVVDVYLVSVKFKWP
jgi:hypothetical protein